MQAARCQQRSGGEQQQAEGQVDARTHLALGLDGIGAEHEHVQQADRQGHGHAAEQQAQEHRPRPPVLDQQQIQGQQLRVQRRDERQSEELGVHPGSARIGHRAVLVSGWTVAQSAAMSITVHLCSAAAARIWPVPLPRIGSRS